jgi:hypothetical protein
MRISVRAGISASGQRSILPSEMLSDFIEDGAGKN